MKHKNWMYRAASLTLVASFMVPLVVAQLVFVPDLNLRMALAAWVPGCMDGNGYLDSGYPAVQAENALDLTVDWLIVDLTGVDALTNLTSLSVMGGTLNGLGHFQQNDSGVFSIPNWPVNLESLKLDRGTWNELPLFPAGLETLYMNAPGQSIMPTIPNGITTLTVYDQVTLSAFPDIPAAVTVLSLLSHGTPFPVLEEGLVRLSLIGDLGVALPSLPNSVDSLNLSNFDAVSLPAWPSSARNISASEMEQVEHLPPFPANMERIQLNWMPSLVSIPPWPSSTRFISLSTLHVHGLHTFPASLEMLGIYLLDSLACMPLLPQGLNVLTIDPDGIILPMFGETSINCLPNFPPAFELYWNDVFTPTPQNPDLLCTSLNSRCPFLNPVASGTVYWDQNENGTRQIDEPGYPYATLHQQPLGAIHGVTAEGSYAWPMPIGDYTLSATGPYVQSTSPMEYALSFTSSGQVSSGNDFGVVLQPNVQDLRVDLTQLWAVPGLNVPGTITCENVGSISVDATITFQLDDDLEWVSSTPAPLSVSGNTVTWSVAALQVAESRQISFIAHADPSVALNTPISCTAQIDPIASDATPFDNVSVANSTVVGPYDPNDKQVEPTSLSPVEVSSDQHELTYTIRFQNTGNWPAVNVVVIDTMSSDLQWNSFRKISSSHPCTWELTEAGILTFRFEPINLPDSTNDEPNSHGFVKFAIKPSTTLQLGMAVANSADILFDFNEPVRTLPAVFTVEDGTGLVEGIRSTIHIYPNPVEEVLILRLTAAGIARIQILDALGREHLFRKIASNDVITLPVHGLAPGPYTLRCTTEGGTWSAKFLKR